MAWDDLVEDMKRKALDQGQRELAEKVLPLLQKVDAAGYKEDWDSFYAAMTLLIEAKDKR